MSRKHKDCPEVVAPVVTCSPFDNIINLIIVLIVLQFLCCCVLD